MSDRIYRRNDHRFRNMIVKAGDQNLFPELNTPKSKTRDLFRKSLVEVVTTPTFENYQKILALGNRAV